jgi:hypothetical protein
VIARAVIRVDGPAGGGKTAFVEALLSALDASVGVARGVRDPAAEELVETAPLGDPELERYRRAGADGVARIRIPGGEVEAGDPSPGGLPGIRLQGGPGLSAGVLPDSDAWGDEFYFTDLMQEPTDAVVIEGDSPLEGADLHVFVAPAPPPGSRLFVRRTRDRAAEERRRLKELQKAARSRQGLLAIMERDLGRELARLAERDPSYLEAARNVLDGIVEQAARRPPPEPEPYWAVNRRYAGIERGQLVVITVRDPEERARAEGLVEQLGRLRREEALLRDILGPTGKRIPITAVAGDLRDPRDPGTRKAVARVRRALLR